MLVYETEDIEVTTQVPTTTSTVTTEPTSVVQYSSDISNWYDAAPIATTGDGTVDALNSIASELHMIRILIVLFALVFIIWRVYNALRRGLVKLADF